MLINCPKCGKPISDKAKFCPHCNEIFQEVIERENNPPKDYSKLPEREREQLLNDFIKENPKQAETMIKVKKSTQKNNTFAPMAICVLGLMVFTCTISFMGKIDKLWEKVFLVLGGVWAIGSLIFLSVLIAKQKKLKDGRGKLLKEYLVFEKWLKEQRHVENFKLDFFDDNMKKEYERIKEN